MEEGMFLIAGSMRPCLYGATASGNVKIVLVSPIQVWDDLWITASPELTWAAGDTLETAHQRLNDIIVMALFYSCETSTKFGVATVVRK